MAEETKQGCCSRCLGWVNNVIWASQDDILQFDFLKPAPCISHMGLVVLRVVVSVSLGALALTAIITTADEIGFQYLSMWTMLQSTVLFAFMAVIQVKNQRRLERFKVTVTRESMLDKGGEINRQSTAKVDTPWHFWKWIIVIYQSCFVLSMSILVNFWITELGDDEFLIYTGSGGDLLWDMICSLPFILILIEYPFN